MRLRPKTAVAKRHGGPYKTDGGFTRSLRMHLNVETMIEAWEKFPQNVLMAGAIRFGYDSWDDIRQHVEVSSNEIQAMLADLHVRQAAVLKKQWTHEMPLRL